MSEKVGSGDNASQLLEQEQILLDWQDLSSYAEMTRPAGVEEVPVEQLQVTEVSERLTAQARGDRLLRAAVESLPEEKPVVLLETSSDTTDTMSGVDTLVMRAEQALGYDQFRELTKSLLELSYTEDPDNVMSEFRREAQKVSSIDAGDLWEAVSHRAKEERFGEKTPVRKFYYSTSLEDLKEILKSGELVRTDKEGSSLKSDLKFSYDKIRDGEWKSGFADERGAKSQEVTMVFDDGLLDEETFVAFGENPSASMVDWRKHCLGLVTGDENYVKVRRMINAYGKKEVPVYLDKMDWMSEAYPADEMRATREVYAEKMRRAEELAEMVYDGGADELITKHVEEVGARVHKGELEAFYNKYHNIDVEDSIQRHAMIEEMVDYYKEIFGVFEPVDVRYKNDGQDFNTAACSWHDGRVRMMVNEAWTDHMEVGGAIMVFGHEMCHAYQDLRADVYASGASEKASEHGKYDELCYFNRMDYIGSDVDPVLYREQFLEREAYQFGYAMQEKYSKVVEEMERLSERVKRVANKAGKKIIKLGVGRKKVKYNE